MSSRIYKNMIVLLGLLTLAIWIRVIAAREAYPASGDAGHFAQHGIALANHVPGAMSTYWSQGMTCIAAAAVILGRDPRYALQQTTIAAGVLVVVLFAHIVFALTNSWLVSLIGGIVLATNHTMVLYSITGYSEMPYIVFILCGICLLCTWHSNRIYKYVFVGALVGGGGYFKGLDAAVAACGIAIYIIHSASMPINKRILSATAIVLTTFLVLVPLCSFTYAKDGYFTPGSKGSIVLNSGDLWKDSKYVYAYNSAENVSKRSDLSTISVKKVLPQIPRRIAGNAADTIRIINEQLFIKGWRIGSIWFGVLLVILLGGLWRGKVAAAVLPISLLAPQLGLLWIALVHDRILAPSLPWIILLFLLSGRLLMTQNKSLRSVGTVIIAIYVVTNICYSKHAFTYEFAWWRYANIVATAHTLERYGNGTEVVMTYGPYLAVEYNKTNPLSTVEVPYGTIEQVESTAAEKNVRFVVISDTWRGHWPVAGLFTKSSLPPKNWCLLEELKYPENDKKGAPAEICRIYMRRAANTYCPSHGNNHYRAHDCPE